MVEVNWGDFFAPIHYGGISDPVQNRVKGVLKILILQSGQLFLQSNYNWVVDRRNMPVEDLVR